MEIKPIHELPVDEVNLILRNAEKFIEWNIEPKYCHLNALINSIKQSLIYFLPDDEDLIKNMNDEKEATDIINSFPVNSPPHPLREGLILLREIFNVMNTKQNLDPLKMGWAINDYLLTVEPFILKEKLNNFHLTQSAKAKNPRMRNGIDPQAREKRNNRIRESFKTTKLSLNSFAKNEAKKHNLSPSQIKKIIKP
jgi:hypothetical protein